MRNLTVHRQNIQSFGALKDVNLNQLLRPDVLCCSNPLNDDLYFLNENRLYVISSDSEDVATFMELDPVHDTNCKPVGLVYCSVTEQLYCAYNSGDLVRICVTTKLDCEVVDRINGGLKAIQLSPDHEIVTLITGDNSVVTMTASLHVIAEVNLNSSSFGEKQFMTVGWGKKETQFHGSKGKSAATATKTTVRISEFDDDTHRITWRGDGTLFAVGFSWEDTGIRCFKVFNREGVLQYTSEPTDGLEGSLSWKPSGNLIATTQRLPNKHTIAFFEKNGLKHTEFSLPFEAKEIVVRDLLWSPDSDILIVWCEDVKSKETTLQLWMENNSHWYLKQSIPLSKENPIIYVTWSGALRSTKELIILTAKYLITYSFRWVVNHSRGNSLTDKAVVGVIDGDKALLTGFRIGIVPPPMAHQTLHTETSVNEIIFAPENKIKDAWVKSSMIFCVLRDNRLALYKHVNDSNVVEYEHVNSYSIEWEVPKIISQDVPYCMHHFVWFMNNIILCAASSDADSYLCVLQLVGANFGSEGRIVVRMTDAHHALSHLHCSDIHNVTGPIEHIVPSPDREMAYIAVGELILQYTEDGGIVPYEVELAEPCHQIEIIEIDKKHVIVSLTNRYRLYIDGKEVASNVTSFYMHTEFLLLTTLQHALICVTLDKRGFEQLTTQELTVKPWEDDSDEKTSTGLSLRRVERGSYLIMAIPKDNRTILQMPRGNLECIQPRALSIRIIGTYLDNLNYFAAFDLMRKQRINLNLIYDHDPWLFVQNAVKFIEDIKRPTWLSLFLSELHDDDVTATIYASCYASRKTESPEKPTDKVASVCVLLRNIMEGRQDAHRLILPILTSLVKRQERENLEAALEKIKLVKMEEDKMESKCDDTSEEALKYLLYLVDVNVLFDIALGMYDFDLVMLVADKSLKDPKEYVPFLNDLKKLEENYMRYTIDKHLKRFDSALTHIVKCHDKFNECVSLVRCHDLYAHALKLFDESSEQYKEIARMYADHLLNKKRYNEAAIMYSRSDDFECALSAYKQAGNWQEAIVVGIKKKLSLIDSYVLYEELVSRLKDEKRYKEAAEILLNCLDKPEDTVAVLCDGKEWRDAMRVAHYVQRTDLIETHVKPGVQEHASFIISQVSKNRRDFEKYKARLAAVRAEKSAKQALFLDGIDGDYEGPTRTGDDDLFSDSSSIVSSAMTDSSRSSRASGRSYRSSKNRRKQERKLLSMKEGSPFEDLMLVRVLYQIVTNAYKQRDEVNQAAQMLLHFHNDEEAEILQYSLNEFLRTIEASKSQIWTKDLLNNLNKEIDENPFVAQYGQTDILQNVVEPYMMCPPVASPNDWTLDILLPISKVHLNALLAIT